MREKLTAILMASLIAMMLPLSAITASAQTRYYDGDKSCDNRRGNRRESRRYDDSRRYNNGYYTNDRYYDDNSYYGKRPNIYDRHRKAINLGGGALAGAIVGGLIGGKKGALIGAGAGVVGGAIVTKKQRPRNYYRFY